MYNGSDLNKEQYKAATFTGKDILLAAGPGSGKTHTMTSRILYLINDLSVEPSSILVITFTKDAAVGMRKRFNEKSEIPLPVAFGTFHSVFYNMIRESCRSTPPIILYDRNKSEIASNVIRKYLGYEKSKDIKGIVSEFLRAVSLYKNTLDKAVTTDSLRTYEADDFQETGCLSSLFPDMFKYYENIRRKSGLLDFDDMVYDCRHLLLHDRSFIRKWKNRFSHILIDEFQDINKAQYETVKLLAGTRSEIFAVGDDDQSIYGFRGSDPSILKTYLAERSAELMYLSTNYRSVKSIVDASALVIGENKNRIDKNPHSIKKQSGNNLFLRGFNDRICEYEYIKDLITQKKNKMAVLFRTNIEMQSFAAFLTTRNVPYRISEKMTGLFEHFIIKDIYSYLQNIYGEMSEKSLNEIINKPPRYIDHEYIIGSGGNLETIIKKIALGNSPHKHEKINKLHALRKDLLFMKNISVKSTITYLYKKIGYEKYIYSLCKDDNKKLEYQKILSEGERLFSEAECLDDILGIKEKYESGLNKSRKKQDPDIVDLMTVHASKGLEFNTVIIPDVNEGNFPHGKMPDEETISEERRIFYVAMTRAEEKLYLFYQKGSENGKNMPSRFLAPLIKKNMHKKENGLSQ